MHSFLSKDSFTLNLFTVTKKLKNTILHQMDDGHIRRGADYRK